MTAEALLDELRDPSCYPGAQPAAELVVEIVQTHLSVVCLAGDLVYKLKKAVALPFVDFSTLAKRRATCRDEVRLNRRLCPDTYLGTCALRRTPAGLRFAALGDDDGAADLDVAVVMRRLPAARMLDALVANGTVTTAEIERLAGHIAAFHVGAARGPEVARQGDPDRLAAFAAANFAELPTIPGHGLSQPLMRALARTSANGFARILPALRRRCTDGFVVDGHGDLHARNVCMTEPPTVYDCIEFEPAFRCGDVATENAFLVMDLRYRGAPALAASYVRAYVRASADTEQPGLLPILCAYRAMVRAKVAALAAAEPELPTADRDHARRSAHRHVLLAAASALEAHGPRWLVVFGPPASGKSRLCTALREIADWPHLATDVVRKQLANLPATTTADATHYSSEFSSATYRELLRQATAQSANGAPVVLLDGNFPTADQRAAVRSAALAAGAAVDFACVDVDLPTALARAATRQADPSHVSDAGPEVARRLHAAFAHPKATEGLSLVLLDGAQPTEALVLVLLTALLAATPATMPGA